ncbi:efflux RND transporter periplasmic adaptor subunit [Shewanella intestini]|uniref:Efflux RND transporter periplasmic adaptor subunit n=1 Tax=Shewanella intestini TaxID=2017544 RepID=A0ABS5I3C8_9GAMM|nr:MULTISPECIES: efflux RND transporter periplasmic adaptor subunit [Shewanella]MBR9728537.1 efflux RND transporter periplasmic adaptor subunit [Shewanella intestini]MRG36356.1 efflux RND transporter periplasmic adaptor subunit [Shewanella sp. XMDDZSB0408]
MKKWHVIFISLSMVSFTLFVGNAVARDPHAPTGSTTSAVPVVTSVVQEEELAQSISLIGNLQAERSVYISSQVAGKISQIDIGENHQVAAGDTLVVLEHGKSKAAVAEAKAYLADQKRILNEYLKLSNQNAITQTEIAAQQASVDMGKARLAAAQSELDYHTLKAPFSGTAGLIDFSLGKMITAGSDLLAFDDLSSMRLDLQVPEKYLSQLSTGMTVSAQTHAWSNTTFIGKIIAIDTRINQDTLNLRVRVQFDNPKQHLKPGMMMSAKLTFPATSQAVIPVQAIEYSGTKRFVYLVDDRHVVKRTQVTLGARVDNEVLITQGVNAGDLVVVQGLVNMRDGLNVNVVPSDDQPSVDVASKGNVSENMPVEKS